MTIDEREQIEREKQFVFEYVKKGYSNQEILAADETGLLTLQIIKDRKRFIIEHGWISAEETKKKADQRKRKKLKVKHEKDMETIKELVEQGYTVNQIAEVLGSGPAYVSKLIAAYKEENEWYTNAEHKDFQNKDENVFKERNSILEKLQKGFPPSQIVNMMKEEGFDITINRVKKVRKQLILRGIISAEEVSIKVKEKEKSNVKKKHIKDAIKIQKLLDKGYSTEEVDKELQISRNYRNKVLNEYKEYQEKYGKEIEENKGKMHVEDVIVIQEKKEKALEEKKTEEQKQKEEAAKEKEKEKRITKNKIIKDYDDERKRLKAEQERKKELDKLREKEREKISSHRENEGFPSYGKLVFDFKPKTDTDVRTVMEKEEQQRRYDEIVRRKEAERQKELENKIESNEHRIHIKVEAMRLSLDDVKKNYENTYRSASEENRREDKGIEEVTTDKRKKFLECIEMAEEKKIEMKKKHYRLFEDVLLYHPELANDNLINIYLKKTLKMEDITSNNLDVLKEKIGNLVFTFENTKYESRLKELKTYVDDMSKRRDGIYFITNKIFAKEEK